VRQRSRGWIMSETDVVSVLSLIEEKIRSPKIDVRHQDVLIRLREALENDLNGYRLYRPSIDRANTQEEAA
jgi:hypothetical protein